MLKRSTGLIVFGVGVVLLIVGLMKILPGGAVAGGTLAFFGLLLFGLSFIPRPSPAPDAPPPLSPVERISGMFFEPSRVFQNLRAHPRWLLPLLIIVLFNFAYTTAFTRRLTPERIISFTTDKLVEKGWVPAPQAEEMKAQQVAAARSPVQMAGGGVSQFVWTFVMMAIIGALYMLGVLLSGGRLNFWQALAIAVHAALPVVIIQKVLSLILLYLKDPDDIHPLLGQGGLVTDNLGVLVSPAEHPVLFAVASAFGLLTFYGLWLTATGIRNGGERVSSTTAWSIAIALWAIGLLFAVASSALFPSFMS